MMQLFIERQEIDISESISTLLTYAIDDIRDFGAKNTTFSKTIILPGTKRNNLLFGNIFEVTAAQSYDPTQKNIGLNFNAAVSASAFILNDNIQAFKGIVRLMEIIIDNGLIEYEVSVYGELGGFVAKVGAKKTEDLDFSTYDHIYSVANIAASKDNYNAGFGYYYPNADYGNNAAGQIHNWNIKNFRPTLFVKQYVEKILQGTGYTFDFPLISTERFKRLIVPHNGKVLTALNTSLLTQASNSSSVTAGTFSPYYTVNILINGASVYANAIYSTGSTSVNISTGINSGDTLKITINGASASPVTFNAGTGSIGAFTTSDNITYTYGGATSAVVNIAFLLKLLPTIPRPIVSGETLSYTSSIIVNSSVPLPTPVSIGDTIRCNDTIPKNILQKDFLSSIIKMFNLYVFEDPSKEKHLKITPYIDFFASATAEDWSMKIDRSKPIRNKPMSELNARYYEFEYAKDSDYWNDLYSKRYNENYGSLKYDSNFEFSKESTKIPIIFAGTPLVGYSGEDKVYPTIYKRNAATLEPVDSVIRIWQAKKITGVTSWNILAADNTTVLGSYTSYGYAGHFDDPDSPANDLNFGVPKELFFTLLAGSININQFNVYWSPYMAEITDKDSRLLTATVKLDYKDIYNLDFAKYKWIDGNLYRLNKITDFNATREDTCTAEFLKVISKIY